MLPTLTATAGRRLERLRVVYNPGGQARAFKLLAAALPALQALDEAARTAASCDPADRAGARSDRETLRFSEQLIGEKFDPALSALLDFLRVRLEKS